jgi:metal-responsive CopG/Arc/MetJ family transcriptional regulator
MKTAISLPDELFEAVERLVRRSGRSRSELYAQALHEYVARHTPDEVTEALSAVVEQAGRSREDERFIDASARQLLANTEW